MPSNYLPGIKPKLWGRRCTGCTAPPTPPSVPSLKFRSFTHKKDVTLDNQQTLVFVFFFRNVNDLSEVFVFLCVPLQQCAMSLSIFFIKYVPLLWGIEFFTVEFVYSTLWHAECSPLSGENQVRHTTKIIVFPIIILRSA